MRGIGFSTGASLPATISRMSSSDASGAVGQIALKTDSLLTQSDTKTETKVKDFLAKMKELGSSIKEKLYPTALMDALSHGVSITSKVNSGLGLAHLASSCINKAVHALGIASGALSIADGIRDVVSSRNNHNRAKDVEAALVGVNSFLQNNDELMKTAKDTNVQAAWTKMRDLETLELKVETLRVQLDTQALECANIQPNSKSTGEGNQRATLAAGYSLLAPEEPTERKDPMTLDLEKKMEKTAKTLEATLIEIADLKEEIKNLPTVPITPELRAVLEMMDLKSTLEGSVRVLKERRLDKAIVGCINIAVGIVGVVANVMTLGLAAPIVGLISWGSGQAVKTCLRAYRTATSLTQEDRDSGVMVLKKCYKDVCDAHSQKDSSSLLDAKKNIMLSLKMPLPSKPILIFAAARDDDQTIADEKKRAADEKNEKKAFNRIDKLTKQTTTFDPNINDNMTWKEKTLAVLIKAALLVA